MSDRDAKENPESKMAQELPDDGQLPPRRTPSPLTRLLGRLRSRDEKPSLSPGPAATPADELGRLGIAAGVSLVVLIFTALGLQGDALGRAARNNSVFFFVVFLVVFLGILTPVIARSLKGRMPRVGLAFGIVGGCLIFAGALAAVLLALNSYQVRELPSISFTPAWSTEKPGTALISVKANARSLRASEDMIVRVVGIKDVGAGRSLKELCSDDAFPSIVAEPSDPVQIIWWAVSGPDTDGTTSLSVDIPASAEEFDFVCAWVALRVRKEVVVKEAKFQSEWAVLDLRRSTVAPDGEPETDPSVSPTMTPPPSTPPN